MWTQTYGDYVYPSYKLFRKRIFKRVNPKYGLQTRITLFYVSKKESIKLQRNTPVLSFQY